MTVAFRGRPLESEEEAMLIGVRVTKAQECSPGETVLIARAQSLVPLPFG